MNRSIYFLLVATVACCGCAVTQPQNTPVSQSLERDPTTGSGFYLYVPSSYSHTRPMPVVVTCHGTPPYDIAEHHIREWKFLGEKHGCIIVAPKLMGTDGLLGDGPIVGMANSERRILSILSLLAYRYNIDRANVMITGFSGGGFPTYWVGLRHPDVFSVAVSRNGNFNRRNLEGLYPPSAKQMPIYVYYGSNDPATIQVQSRNAIEYLTDNGFNVSSKVLSGVGHERKPEVAMQFFLDNMNPPHATLPLRPGAVLTRGD
ncbi:MAG: prolyl oligopeptidase family serine peptidase [Planctomycetota bacterium]